MYTLKQKLRYTAMGAALCAAATIALICVPAWHAAIISAAGAVVLSVCAFRGSEKYQAAKLITENPILSVGVASVAEADGRAVSEESVNVVVSGFGILMDGKPYKFGHGGVDLKEVSIDRESIALSFGGEEKHYAVRLLHGVSEPEDIEKLRNRLRYETGVEAKVNGWVQPVMGKAEGI